MVTLNNRACQLIHDSIQRYNTAILSYMENKCEINTYFEPPRIVTPDLCRKLLKIEAPKKLLPKKTFKKFQQGVRSSLGSKRRKKNDAPDLTQKTLKTWTHGSKSLKK
jgi:hypothetical protein